MLRHREHRIESVETRVPGAVLVRGRVDRKPLRERMADRRVPGLGLAVVHEDLLDWTRGYGSISAGASGQVDDHTLFQAASISKPVAAFAAMVLVSLGKLDLDADVNDVLRSWQPPGSALVKGRPVTVRSILSHTAGLNVDGMPGYAPGAPLPNSMQILNGTPPAVNEPVRVIVAPGSEFRYSGGGYTVLELLIAEAAGRPFGEFVSDCLFRPIGMDDSTFAQPLPANLAEQAARGHGPDGATIPGGWEIMPALAASGLWTSARDLALFLLETQRALRGSSSLLSASTAADMLTPTPLGPAALGFWVERHGEAGRFLHTGANRGYRGHVVGYFRNGHGAVVLTNGDNGGTLCQEILNAVAGEYDWPEFIEERVLVDVDATVLDRYVGTYEVAGMQVELVRDGGDLIAIVPGLGPQRLHPESESRFFFADMAGGVAFEENGESRVTVLVEVGGLKVPGHRT